MSLSTANIYHAVAIVDESQLSLAIGKQGLNRLATSCRLDDLRETGTTEMDIAKPAIGGIDFITKMARVLQ